MIGKLTSIFLSIKLLSILTTKCSVNYLRLPLMIKITIDPSELEVNNNGYELEH